VPEKFRRFAGGWTAWLASAIGFFLGIGLTAGLAMTVQGLINRVRGDLEPVQAPDILQRVSFTWGVTAAVLVLLAGVTWLYLRRRRARFVAAARVAFTFGDVEQPRLPTVWLRRVGSAMQMARLKNWLPVVFVIFGVLGVLLAIAAATDHLVERFTDGAENPFLSGIDLLTGTSSLAGLPVVGDDIVIGIGQLTLLGLAGGAVLLARGAIRAEGPRRALNVVWDVIAFWPRSVHPFVPPPYAQEVVPALIRRICWHLGESDPLPDVAAGQAPQPGAPDPLAVGTVVVAAHSQGSLVSLAALLRLPAAVRPHVKWLTCGSQLQQQFPRAFPHYVRVGDLEEVRTAHSWLSLYRDTDPIAGPVTSWRHRYDAEGRPMSCRLGNPPTSGYDDIDEDTGRRICGREWRLLDPPVSDGRFQTSAVAGLRGHSDYWLDRDWRAALVDVLTWVPPPPPPVPPTAALVEPRTAAESNPAATPGPAGRPAGG
jgi:cbb3-type cytochrome oxidase subunit 3